jgi:hypothetical protein
MMLLQKDLVSTYLLLQERESRMSYHEKKKYRDMLLAQAVALARLYPLPKFKPQGMEEEEVAQWFAEAGWFNVGALGYQRYVNDNLSVCIWGGSPDDEVYRAQFLTALCFAVEYGEKFDQEVGYAWLESLEVSPEAYHEASEFWKLCVQMLLDALAHREDTSPGIIHAIWETRRILFANLTP